MRLALVVAISGSFAVPATAEGPPFHLPVDCTLGQSCFIQQYPDADPGPDAADYTCGPLSYDRHSGTDFALPSMAAYESGVDVYAAAPGIVTGLRDGMPDQLQNTVDPPDITNRACGNGVVLRHGAGWETQYCHLRQGSITVSRGQTVDRNTVIAQVGLSGRTEFPHLHLTVRKDGKAVDPFSADATAACGAGPHRSLWHETPAYRPGGLIAVGFANDIPDYDRIKAGTAAIGASAASAPALVVWAYAFGGRAADEVTIEIIGPDGPVLSRTATIEREQAQFFRAAGRRMPDDGWPTGTYRGVVRMVRDGTALETRETTIVVAR